MMAARTMLAFNKGEQTRDGYVGAFLEMENRAETKLIRQWLGIKVKGEGV